MPSYKLTYFNGRGRGEVSRMMFAAAGQKFEDKRIEFADWGTTKKDMPQGTMPVLEVDGKFKISQSMACLRYLAREFSMYGKDNASMTLCDQIIDTALDMFSPYITMAFEKDETKKTELQKTFMAETLPKVLGFLEDLVSQAGGKAGFAVGDSLTVADIMLYVYIQAVKGEEVLAKYTKLAANHKKVGELPKIKKYLESRPKTDF